MIRPFAFLGFAVSLLPAQNRDHPGLVHLGNDRWGTPAEARAAGLVEYRGRWLEPRTARRLPMWERLDAKSESWEDAYKTRSKHYRITTNVPRFIVELEIKPFLDELYRTYLEVFREDFGVRRRGADKKFIRIYDGFEEYRRQTGYTRATPGFIVGDDVLHVFYEDLDPAQFYGTVFHEGAHQFFAAMFPGADLPHWLNEALATYFEGCVYSRATGEISVGNVPPDRLYFAKQQLARASSPDPQSMFMDVPRHEFSALHYALAWSFVHYLTHTENGRYRDGFGEFLQEMNGSGTTPVAEVFESVTGADLAEIGGGWKDHVMALDEPFHPKWVRLVVDGAPDDIDLQSGDLASSIGGIEIFSTAQFHETWAEAVESGEPADVVVLRQEGAGDDMSYSLRRIETVVDPKCGIRLRVASAIARAHNLVD